MTKLTPEAMTITDITATIDLNGWVRICVMVKPEADAQTLDVKAVLRAAAEAYPALVRDAREMVQHKGEPK